jgi:hypothetical protein
MLVPARAREGPQSFRPRIENESNVESPIDGRAWVCGALARSARLPSAFFTMVPLSRSACKISHALVVRLLGRLDQARVELCFIARRVYAKSHKGRVAGSAQRREQAMDLSRFDALLLGISLGGQLLLFFVTVRSRLYRTFPVFCLYILYSTVSDITFVTLLRHVGERTYAMAYFADNVLEFFLQIGILIEVARNVLNPVRRSLPRNSLLVFLGMLAAATMLAMLLSRHSELARLDRWTQYFVHLSFAVAILRLAIFAGIAGFSQFLGIGWKNHVLQIATGYLAYSIAVLAVELLHRFTGGVTDSSLFHLLEQCRIIVWCMVLGYWSYALSRAEAARKEFSPQMTEFLVSMSQVARSNRTASARWYRK